MRAGESIAADQPAVQLDVLTEDRRCRPRCLDNFLRRRFAPPDHDLDRLGLAEGMTVADLGTGVGYYLPAIGARLGPAGRIWAVEPDRASLERARARPAPGPEVRFLAGEASDLGPIATGSVDRALLSLVLCCLVDKERVMDETWRVLRPGGRALITYPRGLVPKFGRKRSLRVTVGRWRSLVGRRPWRELPLDQNLLVRRHLLERSVG